MKRIAPILAMLFLAGAVQAGLLSEYWARSVASVSAQYALYFNGSNQKGTLGVNSQIITSQVGTVAMWLKPTTAQTFPFGSTATNNVNIFHMFEVNIIGNGSLGIRRSVALGNIVATASALTNGAFHFCVWQSNGTTNSIYMDMIPLSCSGVYGWFGSLAAQVKLCLGVLERPTPYEYYQGSIDQLAVWTTVVSSNDLAGIYNSGAGLSFANWNTNQTAGLKAMWTMGEGTGTSLTDSVGTNTITLVGSPVWTNGVAN